MGNSYVISGLRDKRARIAGEIHQAEGALKQRRKQLATLDAVIRMFTPNCDPDMIPPIKPVSRNLFFKYGQLPRMILSILREAEGPMALDRIVDTVIEAKDLTVDRRVMQHIRDTVRATLMWMELRGIARRVLDEPEAWWELVGNYAALQHVVGFS